MENGFGGIGAIMTMLVTGGAGFIGSNFVNYMLDKKEKIVILDSLTYAGNLNNLSKHLTERNLLVPNLHHRLATIQVDADQIVEIDHDAVSEHMHLRLKTSGWSPQIISPENLALEISHILAGEDLVFVYGSIADYDLVQEVIKECDIIVNFAAETHVDRSILNPDLFIKTDVYGTHILLEAARKCENLKRFVHISTDEVYGVATDHSFTELDPINPRNPYSASKAAADRLVYAYNQTYGIPVTIVRPSNNFGPYQYPEKLIPVMIIKALRNEPLTIYGDGKQIRDWLFVKDTVSALDCIIQGGIVGEVYNIAGRNERENIEVVRIILRMLGKDETLIRHIEDRPGHDRRYSLDDTKLCADLGFKHRGNFEEALASTIQWYVDNQEWWRKIIESDNEYAAFVQKWYASKM